VYRDYHLTGVLYDGGNVGRSLAAQSDRVAKIISMGIPFGLGAMLAFTKSGMALR
jgi:hypothetical protein